jgi:hypothetical protein
MRLRPFMLRTILAVFSGLGGERLGEGAYRAVGQALDWP